MEAGKAQFMAGTCVVCHGPNGEGGPVGPDPRRIRVGDRPGLQSDPHPAPRPAGPDHGEGHGLHPAAMAPLAYQTDEQIAAVLTYIRNSFGNKASAVTAGAGEALRSEVGKPLLTEADLIKP